MLDRSVAPQIFPIQKIVLPDFEKIVLDNGTYAYVISGGSQEVIKLELVFDGGRSREQSKLSAKATAHLLKEGTSSMSSAEISEKLDFYGASLSSNSGMDKSTVVLHCLKKHLEPCLSLVQHILEEASFTQEEISKYALRAAQRLKQQLSKNSVQAYRSISALFFGDSHCYGYNTTPEDFETLESSKLKKHFLGHYTSNNCRMYLSGKIDAKTIALVNQYFTSFRSGSPVSTQYEEVKLRPPQNIEQAGNKLQTSIKIGKRLFSRSHPSYNSFVMLNTILGGYFGSRLMSSIREDKGYTYSIYSIVDPMEYDGSFYISTEVGTEYHSATLVAIQEEFKKLQNELIETKELQMAKNYLLGNILSMLDGPLKSSKLIKTLIENNQEETNFNDLVDSIKNISPQEILSLAQEHLNFDDMHKVAVGNF